MTHDEIDEFVKIESSGLCNCACCGSPAELWKIRTDSDSLAFVAGCSHSNNIGPQRDTNQIIGGCPLCDLGPGSNQATRREAVMFWNQFNNSLKAMRLKNAEGDV